MTQKTVVINGTVYDAHTGMPVATPARNSAEPAQSKRAVAPSHAIHQQAQKSQTLNRRFINKQVAKPSQHKIVPRTAPQPTADIQKSTAITKFAAHPADITPAARSGNDIAPQVHPAVAKAQQRIAIQKTQLHSAHAPKPSQVIKQEAVAEALEKAPSHKANNHQVRQKSTRRFGRFASVGSASIALMILGGYFTYLNMPNLSVRVAAAQAGINATYPEYHPDGYSLSGAVAYDQGEVTMKFAANGGPQNFTLSQKKSGWDSTALLDNYVREHAGENYITYSERGLTIYTYGSDAAWVNDGILYTIDGDAPLSGDQIRHIATSM